ncbi:hypothetical protein HNR23_000917 [Nocardiopsis mwathae]|uniref:Uncharacterized protein n=1 Tax=Nocardiopsis mwathae TaxID=1472723 RepID=A0A7W9YEX9_9ACTN|nr:hypothetical protein [Nocardiopsis mwathae]
MGGRPRRAEEPEGERMIGARAGVSAIGRERGEAR